MGESGSKQSSLTVSQGAHSQVLYVASEHSLYSLPVASRPHRAYRMPISARSAEWQLRLHTVPLEASDATKNFSASVTPHPVFKDQQKVLTSRSVLQYVVWQKRQQATAMGGFHSFHVRGTDCVLGDWQEQGSCLLLSFGMSKIELYRASCAVNASKWRYEDMWWRRAEAAL